MATKHVSRSNAPSPSMRHVHALTVHGIPVQEPMSPLLHSIVALMAGRRGSAEFYGLRNGRRSIITMINPTTVITAPMPIHLNVW